MQSVPHYSSCLDCIGSQLFRQLGELASMSHAHSGTSHWLNTYGDYGAHIFIQSKFVLTHDVKESWSLIVLLNVCASHDQVNLHHTYINYLQQ